MCLLPSSSISGPVSFATMSKRSYKQHCGLAVALDLLGERWTLLIMRDLLPGPRRFTDLFAGFSGISTDLLADRLRKLEDSGVVRKRKLRHPVPANVYELTELGEQLRPALAALASWGSSLLPDPDSSRLRLEPRWALISMTASYVGGLPSGRYEFDIDDEVLTVVVGADEARVEYGPAGTQALLRVRCTVDTFFRMASSDGDHNGEAHVDGDTSLLRKLFRSLELPRANPAAPTS
jgi:DNA-binding HxlR family transcriptional regulator